MNSKASSLAPLLLPHDQAHLFLTQRRYRLRQGVRVQVRETRNCESPHAGPESLN